MKRTAVTGLLLGAFAVASSAAVLARLSDAELVEHSESIVVVTVQSSQPSWQDPDGDGVSQIWTTVEVRVDQVLKGNHRPGDTLSLLQMGGQIGEIRYVIPGLPEFAAGERSLLFLDGNLDNPKYTPLTGWAQGRWKVTTAPDGSDRAQRDFAGSCFARQEGGEVVPDQAPPTPEEALSVVLQRFSQEIAAQAERSGR
jgi:hypothetical protein